MGLLFYEVIFVKTQEYLEDENQEEDMDDEDETDSIEEPSKKKNIQ